MKRNSAKGHSLFLLLSLFFLLSACSTSQISWNVIGNQDAYTASVLAEDVRYSLSSFPDEEYINAYSFIHNNNLVECLDVQVHEYAEQNHMAHFLPQCLSTVVIVVDQDKTSFRPSSWNDLLVSDVNVTFPKSQVMQRLCTGALAYGLEGENYSGDAAVEFLKALRLQDNLTISDDLNEITICLDTQAVRWIEEGYPLKIIIPEEGTFSYALGILSENYFPGASDRMLLKNGLRLLDGSTINNIYPGAQAYAPASRISDPDHFNNQTQNIGRRIRREVSNIRKYSTADRREDIIFMTIIPIITVIWAASALYRVTHKVIRTMIYVLAGLIISWMLITLMKYQLSTGLITRILWYSYYPFLIGLPLLLLYTSIIIDKPDQHRSIPKWFLPFLIIAPLLIIMVYTNDFHHWVFRFDLNGNWSDDYTYNFGYYLIFLYCVITFLSSLIILIRKSRKSPKKQAWIYPVTVAILLIGYNAGYMLGIPLIRESNLAMVFCGFSILFLESVLHAGLIPNKTHYKELFSNSLMKMQLLDHNGNVVLSASNSEPLDDLQRFTLMSNPSQTLVKDEHTLLHSHRIHGGTAVWQEDITQINQIQHKISTSVEQLKAANALLQKEEEIRHRKIAADIKTRLFDLLEKDIEDKTQELSRKIHELSVTEDKQRQISYIILLLCHIKRRCNLFFIAQEGNTVSSTELAVYLDELSEFASYAQIQALVRSGISEPLDVQTATLCYDFYFSLLSWAIQSSRATLIGQLEYRQDHLTFGILSSEKTTTLVFPDSFISNADRADAVITFRSLEDTEGIYLIFTKKGGKES